MDVIASMMNNLVSVSDFNKGEAGRIFDAIKKNNIVKLVLKRNEPECVLISPTKYQEMTNELEDLRDYKLAIERMASQNGDTLTLEQILDKYNVSQAQLDEMEDVEFE